MPAALNSICSIRKLSVVRSLALGCLLLGVAYFASRGSNIRSFRRHQSAELDLTVLRRLVEESGPIVEEEFNVQEFVEEVWAEKVPKKKEIIVQEQVEAQTPTARATKTVLYWNEAYDSKEYGFCCGRDPYIRFSCPVTDCYVTTNRSEMPVDQFDAILFHQRSTVAVDVPANRSAEQRYIMFMIESAQYPMSFQSSEWNGFFNWTMTYRRDSDFFIPYGSLRPVRTLPANLDDHIRTFGTEHPELAEGKTKLVAWFVSNCETQSRREQYVRALQQHIQVDIYGECGPLKCGRDKESKCWAMAQKDYKFYLAFENSVCKDYVTEKFFNVLGRRIVPIVLGGADYETFAPKNSYIDAYRNFSDPADLARYIKILDEDDFKYAEYFWWMEYYSGGTSTPEERAKPMCEICERLHSDKEKKVYEDLEDWWVHDSKCRFARIKS